MVCLGFLPLVLWHVAQLSQKSHYHFLLFFPIAAYALARNPTRPTNSTGFTSPPLILGLLVVSLIGLTLGILVWSPWLAAVFAIVSVIPCLWFARGWDSVRQWSPVWLLSWMMIPPPFGLDEDLILWLRGAATKMTSRVLDEFGVLHLSYSNVIELPEKKLFVADACSGIHSLYVLVAAALFIGLLHRRNWIHTLCLIVTTFALVLVENVARLSIVALGFQYRMDLSEGPNHGYLGFGLFLLSLVLVLSADQLLRFVLGANPTLPFYGRTQGFVAANQADMRPAAPRLPQQWRKFLLSIACVFPLLGVMQLFASPGPAPNISHLFDESIVLPDFAPESVPQEFSGFQFGEYDRINRVAGDPFGQSSQQWTYTHPDGIDALISVDFPYSGVHDACLCYTQVGWNLLDQKILSEQELADWGVDNPSTFGPVGLATMKKQLEGDGLLISSCSDLRGDVAVVLKEKTRQNAAKRLTTRFNAGDSPTDGVAGAVGDPPFVQFQLLAKSAGGFRPEHRRALLNLYLKVREILKHEIVNSSNQSQEPRK